MQTAVTLSGQTVWTIRQTARHKAFLTVLFYVCVCTCVCAFMCVRLCVCVRTCVSRVMDADYTHTLHQSTYYTLHAWIHTGTLRIDTHKHTHTHTYTHLHTHKHTHTHTYAHLHTHIHMYMHVCTQIHTLFVSAPECRDIETVLYDRTSVRMYVFSELCSIFQYVIKRWLRALQLSRSR